MAIGLSTASSCSGDKSRNTADTLPSPEEFHADYDIAMVVRSLADAISVGEKLDSADYDYSGILTDGQGTPLYTDVQGSPGLWEVDILSPGEAVIRNIYLGDLLTHDLEEYVTASLHLTPEAGVTPEYRQEDDSELTMYSIPGGELRFETRTGIAPNGLEGPLLSIVIARTENTDHVEKIGHSKHETNKII